MIKNLLIGFLLSLASICLASESLPEIITFPQGIVEGGLPMSEDAICIAWTVKSEAGGEPVKGKRAIIDVILTRMRQRNMTACQVLKEPFQFSGFTKHTKLRVTIEQLTELEMLINMEPVVEGCSSFHAVYVHPKWHLKFCKRVGRHLFYY
jgi:spore germination cell wall hydrolase CwlJ-like protein